PKHLAFAEGEATKGFGGLLRSFPTLWVSHPDAIAAAEWKPRQLAVAREEGFTIPRTLVTNSASEALTFVEEMGGRVIYKTLQHPFLFHRSSPDVKIIYSSLVTSELLKSNAEGIAATTNLFQQYIDKAYDVRVTVFGRRVFATA